MQGNLGIFLILTVLCTALAEHTRVKRRMYAMCPPNFKRIGSECYFISGSRLNWLDAHFECKDKNSKLAEPGKAADRKLRSFLTALDTDPDEIWIGGAYDWNSLKWHWGYNGKEIMYQSFSQMDPGSSQDLRYHCAVLNPSIKYRWSARSCVDRHRFICQHKMPKVSEKNRVKVYNRWNETYPNQLANEVLLEILDNGENGTRRSAVVKLNNATYRVDCKIQRVTHRRVKAVGSADTFTIPVRRRLNPIRRRRKRPQSMTEGYQGTEPYATPQVYQNDVSNGHFDAHDLKESVAQFAPDPRNDFKPIPTRAQENSTPPNVVRGRWRQKPTNDENVEANETIQNPKSIKPRQKTDFDREIEIKRRRERERRKKQELHRRKKQELREKARREKEEQDRRREAEEQQKMQEAAQREAENRRRMEEQQQEKRRQREELEALKQQQLEELEKERHQAELAHKRRQEIEKQQKEARDRQDSLETDRLEKKRLKEEEQLENERLRRQREYQEELERKRKANEERKMFDYDEADNGDSRARNMDEQRRVQAEKEAEDKKREEQYKKLLEEREKEERRREHEELLRLEEEDRKRAEKQKVRDEEIRRREEIFRQEAEEEKRLAEESRRREQADRTAREEEQRRKEEESHQKEEEERRKREEIEEKRRQKEIRKQKSDNVKKGEEEEQKRLKLQKLRERLSKLSPEEQKKFFEMRQQRNKKRAKDTDENESTIPE